VTVTLLPVASDAQASGAVYVVVLVSSTGTPRTVIVLAGQVPETAVIESVPSTTKPSAAVDQPRLAAHIATMPASAGLLVADLSAALLRFAAAPTSFTGDGAVSAWRVTPSEHPAVMTTVIKATSCEHRVCVM
jgi:hypothetical protein